MHTEYLFTDPPRAAYPPENMDIVVESGGCALYGSILLAPCGEGETRPTALLLHGFPGHEKNLDLAQALRRAGMNTAFFSYRGAWGSEGTYAVSHLVEDACAVLAHLQAHAQAYRMEADNLWLIGHSLGGFTALATLASRRVPLRGGVLIAPCDLGMMALDQPARFTALVQQEDAGRGCLHIARPGRLREEALQLAQDWRFSALAASLSGYPLLFVGGAQDDVTPCAEHIAPLLAMLSPGADYCELADGHSFAASRVALTQTVGGWLAGHSS